MNYLAHLLLAGDDPEAQVGQVLADLVRPQDIRALPPGVRTGIRAHQRIDVFADSHPDFSVARRRLRPPYRRFAGVLVDVFFDHFLARDWDRHGDGSPLPEFATAKYRVLRAHRDLPVRRYRQVVDAMEHDDWLVGYSELAGVDRALRGISKRCRRPNPLASGLSALEENYVPLRIDFETFFPKMREFAATLEP